MVEETPSPILTPELRAAMGEVAVKAAKAVGYVGAGTVEFLVDANRNFYFLEMNTRLQVEHPVTEWVTGIDLVAWQIHVAAGRRAAAARADRAARPRHRGAHLRGGPGDQLHAVARHASSTCACPAGPFVRDDSGVYAGYTVPNVYDPMISKLSVWAPTRTRGHLRACAAPSTSTW